MQSTSGQRIERLANDLAAEQLVELIDNPRHRRSKLVRLTPKGEACYRASNTRFVSIASTMGEGLGEAEPHKMSRPCAS